MSCNLRVLQTGLAALLALACGAARGEDHFLTIGGGYSPTGNQVSLEKNVLYFQRLLSDMHLAGEPHEIFFSDGDDPRRDVEFADPSAPTPRVNLLLARVFGREDLLEYRFRTNQVPGIRGASSPDNIDRWFSEVGARLKPGDRLIIYLTGHGGKGTDVQNPHFFMWNRKQMTVKEFAAKLDKLPESVPVVLVMVQCFSGGFANAIFKDGDAKTGLSRANRCGFYATVPERPAAGCTADIRDENYKEYSTSFWSAICGRSRTGQTVAPPDYDGDGKVSFAEAHAYTVLSSDTIDIPVKTSDAFLRAFSTSKPDKTKPDLLTIDSPYDVLLAAASPIDRAVLEGLSAQLGLTGGSRAQAARDLALKTQKDRNGIDRGKKRINDKYQAARREIAESLKLRWPELENPWHPQTIEDMRTEGPEIVSAIESHGSYSTFDQMHNELEQRSTQSLDLDRRWAKCQRFLRFAENVALAANLAKVASQEIQDRYRALLASESGTLCGPGSTAQ
jgi:Peptidase C13 family